MNFNLSISTMPVHLVMWQDVNTTLTGNSTVPVIPVQSESEEVKQLKARIEEQEKKVNELASKHMIARPSPYFSATQVNPPMGLEILTPMQPSTVTFRQVLNSINEVNLNKSNSVKKQEDTQREEEEIEVEEEEVVVEEQEEQEEEEVVVEEEEEQGEEEVVVEEQEVKEKQQKKEEAVEEVEEEAEDTEEEAEEEEEEEEEGEAKELEEFEYKGVTYYKDSENQVYKMDEDGDLDDTPIGVWNEEKQKLLKYKV